MWTQHFTNSYLVKLLILPHVPWTRTLLIDLRLWQFLVLPVGLEIFNISVLYSDCWQVKDYPFLLSGICVIRISLSIKLIQSPLIMYRVCACMENKTHNKKQNHIMLWLSFRKVRCTPQHTVLNAVLTSSLQTQSCIQHDLWGDYYEYFKEKWLVITGMHYSKNVFLSVLAFMLWWSLIPGSYLHWWEDLISTIECSVPSRAPFFLNKGSLVH